MSQTNGRVVQALGSGRRPDSHAQLIIAFYCIEILMASAASERARGLARVDATSVRVVCGLFTVARLMAIGEERRC